MRMWKHTSARPSGGSVVKEPPASAGETRDLGSTSGSGRSPGEGNGHPFVFLPGKFCGQGSLAGYSPWGCKESDVTEHAHMHGHVPRGSTSFRAMETCEALKRPPLRPLSEILLRRLMRGWGGRIEGASGQWSLKAPLTCLGRPEPGTPRPRARPEPSRACGWAPCPPLAAPAPGPQSAPRPLGCV